MPYDSTTQKYTYKKIVEANGKTAHDLYTRAKNWCKHKYMHDKPVIDEENTELGDNGNFEVSVVMNNGIVKMPVKGTTIYNLNLRFKDGKCKIVITDIKVSDNANGTTSEKTMEVYAKEPDQIGGMFAAAKSLGKKVTADYMNDSDTEILKVIAELEKVLTSEAAKDDW